jgi:hypothetical protein
VFKDQYVTKHEPIKDINFENNTPQQTRVRRDADAGRGRKVIAREGPFERGEVVRADGHQRPLAADVLMQLVLQVDEAAAQ